MPPEPEKPDFGTFAHRSAPIALVLMLAASVLAALHREGILFSAGAVATAIIAFFIGMIAVSHDWSACSLCTQPPRTLATAEARTRLARKIHRFRTDKFLMLLLVAHAVLPKPYMEPWWTVFPAAVFYAVTVFACWLYSKRVMMHKKHLDECGAEWCRAGLNRKPGTLRSRRELWCGHYGMQIIMLLTAGICTVNLLPQHEDWQLRTAYGILLLLLGLVIINMMFTHLQEPCLRCVKSLPDNGSQLAEARMGRLKMYHHAGPVLLVGSLLMWFVSMALAGTPGAKVLIVAVSVLLVLWAVLSRLHAPVKPWCPWCKDGGGEHECEHTPDPNTQVPA